MPGGATARRRAAQHSVPEEGPTMSEHSAPERRAYRITGRVQGVGFRWWTLRHARDLGIAGFVRNQPDGSVDVAAEGDPADLQRLEALLSEGPPAAYVRRLERYPAPEEPLPYPFQLGR